MITVIIIFFIFMLLFIMFPLLCVKSKKIPKAIRYSYFYHDYRGLK